MNRILDLFELGMWATLLAFGVWVAAGIHAEMKGTNRPPPPAGLVEAEDLELVAKSGSFELEVQATDEFPSGRWSGNRHLFVANPPRGSWIEFRLPETTPGFHRLELFLTRAPDYGIVGFDLNGDFAGDPVDLFTPWQVQPAGAIDLGRVELNGNDVLRLTVTGTNPGSRRPHFQFGIDGVRITQLPDGVATADRPESNGVL